MTRTAFVTTLSPLKVTYSGTSTELPALKDASYTPALHDRVAVVTLDTSKLLIVCKVG